MKIRIKEKLQLLEISILEGNPLRVAIISAATANSTIKSNAPQDYERLRKLARAVKKVNRGCTIRDAAKTAGIPETSFKGRYPHLADKCRDYAVKKATLRLVRIAEHLSTSGDKSLMEVAIELGETANMVDKAFVKYYGLGEKNKYGFISRV